MTMRFNFLKLFTEHCIFLGVIHDSVICNDVMITSSVCSDVIIFGIYFLFSYSIESLGWLTQIMKLSTFVKVMQRKLWPLFSRHGV